MNKVFISLLSIFSFSAFAETPVYYWDNQDKLVEASDRCKVLTLADQPFRISQYFNKNKDVKEDYENLRNLKGIKQSYVANGSIIKIIKGEHKYKHDLVNVVGVNQSIKRNRWYSERGDEGYLFYRSMLPLEDYVLKIPNQNIPGIEKTAIGANKSSYWSIASGKSFFRLKCPDLDRKREYVLFKVYKYGSSSPDIVVAVSTQETSLFKAPKTLSKYDVSNELPDFLQTDQGIDYVSLRYSERRIKDTDEEDLERIHEDDLNIFNTGIGSVDDVVCTSNGTLNVRSASDNLKKILFKANVGEKVKVFQGFNDVEMKKTINGEEYTYKKVQFSEREGKDQSVGWVAKRFIKPRSKCKYLKGNTFVIESDTKISGIDDPNCCEFPTVKKVTHRFNTGMRRYKSGRSGGKRLHAACDLYRYKNEEILAVAPGKVIQGVEYFYLGTYSLVVEHSGGFVVRYGEITSKKASGVKLGADIKMGQRIGYIGQVELNVRPMLHFELYDGSKTGPLTIRSGAKNKFQRRNDIMDPTKYLLKWEESSF